MRHELNQYYVAENVGDLTFCENLGCVRHKPGVYAKKACKMIEEWRVKSRLKRAQERDR